MSPDRARFDTLHSRIRFPLFGNDCFGYGLVASGWVDLVVEAKMHVYDWTALIPVVEGAGGTINVSNWVAIGRSGGNGKMTVSGTGVINKFGGGNFLVGTGFSTPGGGTTFSIQMPTRSRRRSSVTRRVPVEAV